jgi:rubrerythrin
MGLPTLPDVKKKPTYLGLLNAIAVGEQFGHELFAAWSEACQDPELKATLDLVALREAEHAAAFTKRIAELGFDVRGAKKRRNSESSRAALTLAGSPRSDRKKFKKLLGFGKSTERKDRFSRLLDDTTIDPSTAALLGRFIAEERDSGRQLKRAYDRLISGST